MNCKRCTACGIDKQAEDFSRNRASKDGLQHKCKACTAAYGKQYRDTAVGKEKRRGRDIRRWERRKPELMERARIYREANRERLRAVDTERVVRLSDDYIKSLLRADGFVGEIPPSVIEARRLIVAIRRELAQRKEAA